MVGPTHIVQDILYVAYIIKSPHDASQSIPYVSIKQLNASMKNGR